MEPLTELVLAGWTVNERTALSDGFVQVLMTARKGLDVCTVVRCVTPTELESAYIDLMALNKDNMYIELWRSIMQMDYGDD
jgi:hypothetical protein